MNEDTTADIVDKIYETLSEQKDLIQTILKVVIEGSADNHEIDYITLHLYKLDDKREDIVALMRVLCLLFQPTELDT